MKSRSGTLSILFICSSAWAARDWSKMKTRVAPGFAEEHSRVDAKITGGEEVAPHTIRYQAGLFITTSDGTAFCGGSLISEKYVLTAAHCAEDALEIQVVLGAHEIREDETTQLIYEAARIIVNKGWNSSTLKNDIALLELPEKVPLSAQIQPVDLPTYSDIDDSFTFQTATVSGWGKDSDKAQSISPVLRVANVEVISNLVCKRLFRVIRSTHVCTSGSRGKSACNGDSGGPLVIGNKQIGVVSFGIAFGCEIGWPSAYTRVSKYLDWIADNTDIEISY